MVRLGVIEENIKSGKAGVPDDCGAKDVSRTGGWRVQD